MTSKRDDSDMLKDGEVLRVSMMLMDGVPRAVTGRSTPVSMVGHRPGSLPLTDAQRSERVERQRAYNDEVSQRWRSHAPQAPGKPRPDTARARYQDRLTNAWRRP